MYGGRIQHDVPTAQLRGRGRQLRIHQQSRRAVYTSQSNVSNSIKALEEELGIQIFLRTKKGVSVTEEGREFLSYANEIIDKKIFVEDLYAKSHFRKQYFSVSSMRSFFLSTPITRLWPQISRRPRRLYLYQAEKQSFTMFWMMCSTAAPTWGSSS